MDPFILSRVEKNVQLKYRLYRRHNGMFYWQDNTETHVCHKEGSRFYGKTKTGKYVSEADAMKEGR